MTLHAFFYGQNHHLAWQVILSRMHALPAAQQNACMLKVTTAFLFPPESEVLSSPKAGDSYSKTLTLRAEPRTEELWNWGCQRLLHAIEIHYIGNVRVAKQYAAQTRAERAAIATTIRASQSVLALTKQTVRLSISAASGRCHMAGRIGTDGRQAVNDKTCDLCGEVLAFQIQSL